MASSYPPPTSKTRSSKQHGHHRSLSSNANTLISAPGQSTAQDSVMNDGVGRTLSPPPSSYPRVEPGRKGNHRAKRSSFSMTSTLAEPQPAIPLTQHARKKSSSSILKAQDDVEQLPLPASTAGKSQWQPPYDEPPLQAQAKEQTCCGVVQESVDRAREDRYGESAGLKAQPWVVLKFMVAVTFGLMGYAAYVYIGILVVPMLQEKDNAQGTRREGIGLLVGFSILFLWTVWAYFKIVTTSPGYAKDHIPQTARPPCINASGFSPRPSQTLSASNHRRSQDSRFTLNDKSGRTNNIAGPSYEQLSEMLAAPPNGVEPARVPDLDTGDALSSGASPSDMQRAPEPLNQPTDSLKVRRPSLVGRTTSTITVKSMSISVGSKKTGSSPVALKYDEGEMASGSPMREPDDGMQWESEVIPAAKGDLRKKGKPVQESEASLSLRNVLGATEAVRGGGRGGEDLEAQAGVVDSALAGVVDGAAGRHQLKRKRGLGEVISTSPAKWLFCCCWWMGSDDGDEGRGKLKPAKPRAYITRNPPTTAVLDPYNRYCQKDGLVKPKRAHHCRNCGTCVLRYDHHCPWIGQCVGARNHKFFLNFCQAAFMCSSYIVWSMIPFVHKGFNDPRLGMNAQEVVIVALSGVFALFTFTLMVSHVYMTLLGQTTVENMQIQTLKERENDSLSKAYRWYEFSGKLKTLKEWDREWGSWSTDGNIWWIGPRRREWEAVMGSNPLGWILPIGKCPNDGLDYPVNPRFDPVSGKRRRREDWPEHLR